MVLGALYTTGIVDLPSFDYTPNINPATLRVIAGTATMLAAVLWGPIGIGLLRLRRWARIVALVLCLIGFPISILQLLSLKARVGAWLLILHIAYIFSAGLVIWLLLQAPVRKAFGFGLGIQPGPDARTRPAGVKFLVGLSVFAAVMSFLFSVAYGLALPFLDPKLSASAETLRMVRIGVVAGSLPWVAAYAFCAFGLWRLRNWARIVAVVLAVFWLFPALIMLGAGVFAYVKAPSLLAATIFLIVVVVMAALLGWILWYLLRSSTRQLFKPSVPAPAESSPLGRI